jgi:hypothetical protein
MSMTVADFVIADRKIAPGSSAVVDVPISALSNRLPMSLPVKVFHGRRPGPVLFVSAAVHGDEIIGVEIIRRLARRPALDDFAGTLLLVPIVNGYGFLNHSRYLPDRRDLNRSFPGNTQGSLADRLAHVFLTEVVGRSDYGIDMHSAAIHRSNLPQIRIAPNDPQLLKLAHAFGAPAILYSKLRPGSLRQSAKDLNVPVLLYEAGEGLRFDETAVRAGVAGILRVMHELAMVRETPANELFSNSVLAKRSSWVRAPEGGLLRLFVGLGDVAQPGERIGVVSDVFGEREFDVFAPDGGLLVGRANLPVVNEGDAVAHLAEPVSPEAAAQAIDQIVEELEQSEMFYEDEII